MNRFLLALLAAFALAAPSSAQVLTSPGGCFVNVPCQAGSLAIGGATIGTDALAVTGTATINGPWTISAGTATASTPMLNLTQTWNNAGVTFTGINVAVANTNSASASRLMNLAFDGTDRFSVRRDGIVTTSSSVQASTFVLAQSNTAIPAGGTAGAGYRFSSTANFGVFFGSGAPTLSAAKGSLYLRSDGSGVNDRMYVNTDGSTTWTAVVTAG
jgi:hypothetical protein